MLLVEHGAKLQVRNKAGVSPVEISPDLRETQQRLCESVAGKFVDATAGVSDMTTLRLLASNDELDEMLLPLLSQTAAVAHILSLCRDSDGFGDSVCDDWIAVIESLFTSGPRRHRASHYSGFLNAIVKFLTNDGKLR